MRLIATIAFSIITAVAFGQTLSTEINSVYTFKPARLSKKEQEARVPALDKIWQEVKGDTAKYLPQLREELKRPGHNPYFYCDGSLLLLSISEDRADKQLAADAIARCDLDDISREIYVSTINKLAQDDINTTPAAIKILQDDKFGFLLVQHAMTFDQGYCLAYMLLPQSHNTYVDTLISLFPTVSKTAKLSILYTLWHTYSCKGDEFITATMTDEKTEKDVRQIAKKMMQPAKLTKDEEEYLKAAGKEHFGEMRKMSLQRFSDEAIDELMLTTEVMRRENSCQ